MARRLPRDDTGRVSRHRLDEMASISPVLEHREHDHARCAADALGHAEEICAREGLRFTPQRRQVLEALLASHVPGLGLRRHRPPRARRGERAAGADLGLPGARFPGRAQPRPPHRIEERLRRLRPRRRVRARRDAVPDLRQLRRGRRSAVGGARHARQRRDAQARLPAARSACWKCAASAPAAGQHDRRSTGQLPQARQGSAA